MIDAKVLFLTASNVDLPALKPHLGPYLNSVSDFEANAVGPLRQVCRELAVYDFWKEYAELGVKAVNETILKLVRANRPRFLLWPSMMYEITEATFQAVRQEGVAVVGWFFDDEWRFEDYSRWWAPYLDFCLTNDPKAVAKYAALGVPATHFLIRSNPEVYRPLGLEKQYDVTFAGRKFGDRGAWIQSLSGKGINARAFGHGWDTGYLSVEELVAVFNQSRINLCFTKALQPEAAPQIKDRIFHICMSGGFLLCEHVPGIEEYFTPDHEIVCFRSLEEATEKIHYYLTHTSEREAVADAGWRRARQDHTQQGAFERALEAASHTTRPQEVRLRASSPGTPPVLGSAYTRSPATFHFRWAKALMAEGYPANRWQAELELALYYEPGHRQARRLRAIGRLPGCVRRKAVRLYEAMSVAKAKFSRLRSSGGLLRGAGALRTRHSGAQ